MPNDTRPLSPDVSLSSTPSDASTEAEPSLTDAFRPTLWGFLLSLFQLGFRQKTTPPLSLLPKRRRGGKGRVKGRLPSHPEETETKGEPPKPSEPPNPPEPLPSAAPVSFEAVAVPCAPPPSSPPPFRGFVFSSAANPFPTAHDPESPPSAAPVSFEAVAVPCAPPPSSPPSFPPPFRGFVFSSAANPFLEAAPLSSQRPRRSAKDAVREVKVEPLSLTLPFPVLAAYARPYTSQQDNLLPLVFRFREGERTGQPPFFAKNESLEAEITLLFSFLASTWMERILGRVCYQTFPLLSFALKEAVFSASDTPLSWANGSPHVQISSPVPSRESHLSLTFRSLSGGAGSVSPTTSRLPLASQSVLSYAPPSQETYPHQGKAKGFAWRALGRDSLAPLLAEDRVEPEGSLAIKVDMGQVPVMKDPSFPLLGRDLPSWDEGFGIYKPTLLLVFEVFRLSIRDTTNA